MADNVAFTPGAGATFATDDIGGIHHQMFKLEYGALDSATLVSPANPLPVRQGDGATQQGMRSDGFARTTIDPTTLIFDTFETLDTTNTWTTGITGTGTAPSAVTGVLTLNGGTAASNSSYLRSQPAFTPGSNAYLQGGDLITLSTAVQTGAKAVWGQGVVAGSPTAAVPLSNGAVFEILDTDGLLYGAVYSNGVRTQSVALTRPTDGAVHRYSVLYKASRVYFELDNVSVGTLPFPNPTVGALNKVFGVFNGLTALGAAFTCTASLLGLADTGRNATQFADGTFPWRKAKIDANGNQAFYQSDGTNIASVVANDTGYNGQPFNNATKTIPFTTSTAGAQTLLANTDVRGYTQITVVYTSVGVGLALTAPFSPNSGGTYIATQTWQNRTTTTSNPTTLGTAVSIIYSTPVFAPFFQLAVSALTSGTFSGFVILSTQPVPLSTINLNSAITQTTTPATPTAFLLKSAATTNATSIKTTAGTLYSVTVSNSGAAAAFVKLFNTTAAPTVGTTIPDLTIPVAASGLVSFEYGALGLRYGTGIALSITNLVADTDTTVVAANQVKVNLSYV